MFYLPPSAVAFLAGDLFAQLSDFLLLTFVIYNKVCNDRYWLPLSFLVFSKMDLRPKSLSRNDRLWVWGNLVSFFSKTIFFYFYANIFPCNDYLTVADLWKLSLQSTKWTIAGLEVVCLHTAEFVSIPTERTTSFQLSELLVLTLSKRKSCHPQQIQDCFTSAVSKPVASSSSSWDVVIHPSPSCRGGLPGPTAPSSLGPNSHLPASKCWWRAGRCGELRRWVVSHQGTSPRDLLSSFR